MPNLVFLTCSNLQILGKTQTGFLDFSQSLTKGNCNNSRISDDIDIKLGPGAKLDKRNKTTSKKRLIVTSCQKIVTSLPFFQFTAN